MAPSPNTQLPADACRRLPLVSRAAAKEATERQTAPWELPPPSSVFYDDVEACRASFAPLIGASANDIALVPATSYAMAVAAKNLLPPGSLQPGDQILVIEQQFQSNYYVWEEAARAAGAEMLVCPRADGFDWTGAIVDILRAELARVREQQATSPTSATAKGVSGASVGSRIKLVSLPTVHWQDGSVLDLVAIGKLTRELGAHFVVDGTQTVGAVPFDVAEVQPDFMCASAYKWLLCPYGLAFLYAAPRWQSEGAPLEHHQWERTGPAFYRHAFTPGARRFDSGQRSNFITLPAAVASLNQLQEWGPANISAYIQPLIERAAARAAELGLSSPPPASRSPHMIGVRVTKSSGLTEEDLEQVSKELLKRGVHVSIRGTAIRISPNVWNTIQDVDRLFDELRTLLPAIQRPAL